VGHIFSMDFPSAYQNWDATNPVDLFDAEVVSIAESKGGIIKHLEREASGMDYLVLWLDCDREGENICFEVNLPSPPSFSSSFSGSHAPR
jgi:DNA topoisomerase III